MEVSRKEALRYLGYGQATADDRVLSLLEWAIDTLLGCVRLGYAQKRFSCTANGEIITMGPMHIKSNDLKKHLQGCQEAILFAATLGPQPDTLLKKYAHLDISKAVILQAAAAAIIESYCDACQQDIETALSTEGYSIKPRFSPGYGDFSLCHQPEILALLDCPRKIGLTVTKSLMLAPTKSVTAVMGLCKKQESQPQNGCMLCGKTDCLYRRS